MCVQVERDAVRAKLSRLEKERENWRHDAVTRVQKLEEKHIELTARRKESEASISSKCSSAGLMRFLQGYTSKLQLQLNEERHARGRAEHGLDKVHECKHAQCLTVCHVPPVKGSSGEGACAQSTAGGKAQGSGPQSREKVEGVPFISEEVINSALVTVCMHRSKSHGNRAREEAGYFARGAHGLVSRGPPAGAPSPGT